MWKLAPAAVLIASLALAGCSSEDANSASSQSSNQIDTKCVQSIEEVANKGQELPGYGVDALGDTVEVTNTDRIVALSPGSAEIIWAMGFKESLVGIDLASIFTNAEKYVVVNPGHEPALETILGLKPTLVIADSSVENEDAVKSLVELGVQVALIPSAQNIMEIEPRVAAIASALGVPESGKKLLESLTATLSENQKVDGAGKTIAFLYLRGNAGVYLMGGKDSGADSIISALGATDVGTRAGITGFAPLTAEALVSANPDIIMVMNDGVASVGGIDKLLTLPGVSSTSAGKTRSIIQADDRVLLSFGLQTGGLISCLSNQIQALETSA